MKRQNSEFDIKNLHSRVDLCRLETANRYQFLGIEDIVNGNLKNTLTVVCETQKAHAIMMSR